MPATSFPKHRKLKHSLVAHVKFIKISDTNEQNDPDKENEENKLIRCRYCINKIRRKSMDRHLIRIHTTCHVCNCVVKRINLKRHLKRKHSDEILSTQTSDSERSTTNSPEPSEPTEPPEPDINVRPSTPYVPEVLRINDYQLRMYMKQGRVYKKYGYFHLRY